MASTTSERGGVVAAMQQAVGAGRPVFLREPGFERNGHVYLTDLSTTARVRHEWAFIHDAIGYNHRMPNLNAALGCAQLEELDSKLAPKRSLALAYAQALAGTHCPRADVIVAEDLERRVLNVPSSPFLAA